MLSQRPLVARIQTFPGHSALDIPLPSSHGYYNLNVGVHDKIFNFEFFVNLYDFSLENVTAVLKFSVKLRHIL